MSQEIVGNEDLARGIFSSKHARKARRDNSISPRVFVEKEGVREISVDRFSLTTPENAAAIAREVAKNRGENRNFYGWAKLTVEQAEESNRQVKASPKEENPYHADIILPSNGDDIEYEEQVDHAQQLAQNSHWQPPPD